MATLSHFPSIHSPLSTPLPLFHFHHHKKILSYYSHQTIFCSSASLTKKFRGSRKVKSEEELRNDIKEFLSIVGLPQDHLPSTNELSNHGRKDLANIVRRRGYKFIRELLGIQRDKESEKMKDLADDISSSNDSIEMRQIEDLVEDASVLVEATIDAVKLRSDSAHGTHEDIAFSGAVGSDLSNGHVTLSRQPVEQPAWKINASRTEILSNEKVMVNHNEDPDAKAQDAEKQDELDRLKYILHQKEKELTKLKEQIEKEKHALFLSQSKAEKEISEAQKLISEKDAELHAAEESLSGLKEVEIRYRGEGETAEVAGSFNGWHQNIKMEPLLSSSIVDLTGLLKSRSWSTLLWLYPGVYEIKFIVDGNWTLDLQREFVTRGHIHNNILRVD